MRVSVDAARQDRAPAPARQTAWAAALAVLLTAVADGLAYTALRRHWPGVVLNPGIGFGLLRGSPGLALGLEVGGLMVVVVLAVLVPPGRTAAAVVVAGGLSNLTMRLMTGHVVDYWHVSWYPYTFNLADLAIRGGVLWFIGALAVSARRSSRETHDQHKAARGMR